MQNTPDHYIRVSMQFICGNPLETHTHINCKKLPLVPSSINEKLQLFTQKINIESIGFVQSSLLNELLAMGQIFLSFSLDTKHWAQIYARSILTQTTRKVTLTFSSKTHISNILLWLWWLLVNCHLICHQTHDIHRTKQTPDSSPYAMPKTHRIDPPH